MPTRKTAAIEIREAPHKKAMLETEMRYEVLLHGAVWGELHFNMRGYRGDLPLPGGRRLDIGEKAISVYRREVARLNREWVESDRREVAAVLNSAPADFARQAIRRAHGHA